MPTEPRGPAERSDFARDDLRREMAHAVAGVAETLGESYPLRIGGELVEARETFPSLDPSAPSNVVGIFPVAGAPEIGRAAEAALRGAAAWRAVAGAERAAVLARAAERLRPRRLELAAWLCFETGATWAGADAQVAAAIDALEMHACAAAELEGPGNAGAGALLGSARAPLAAGASLCGAALAAGAAVVFKPARSAATVGWKLAELLDDAGLPPGALNVVTGPGAAVGEALAKQTGLAFFATAGSGAGGAALRTGAGDRPVVAAREGEHVFLADGDADVADAARRLVDVAFRGSGPRGCAGARALAHKSIRERLLEAVVADARTLRIGPAIDYGTDVGPLPDDAAVRSVARIVENGRSEFDAPDDPSEAGSFVVPAVVSAVPAEIEICGPVLAIDAFDRFEDGLDAVARGGRSLAVTVLAGSENHRRRAADQVASPWLDVASAERIARRPDGPCRLPLAPALGWQARDFVRTGSA